MSFLSQLCYIYNIRIRCVSRTLSRSYAYPLWIMNSSSLAASHPAQSITYVLTDGNLCIIQHSPDFEWTEPNRSLAGMSLVQIAPELANAQDIVHALLNGSLDYWESKPVLRHTNQHQTQIVKMSLIALRAPDGSPQLMYLQQPCVALASESSQVVSRTFVVHEIRTPLTYLRGYLEMLMDEEVGALNAQQHEMMRVLMHSVLHLMQFSDQLLQTAQSTSDPY